MCLQGCQVDDFVTAKSVFGNPEFRRRAVRDILETPVVMVVKEDPVHAQTPGNLDYPAAYKAFLELGFPVNTTRSLADDNPVSVAVQTVARHCFYEEGIADLAAVWRLR